ncbi:PEP/pyruvate-binding domain-containing protein [Kribbella sp. VKM Ac-2568]|uniref:PEP/pyruvate-binding domain-containing protein n=1 Tax=Kribbella sp. VKM Ac-2568 TaxID=2512219 RepID=UPI0018EE519B|nr:PEP/pyruvate-binding domain-containing protein [Kribbella sp. VKM Ac-2568]
MIIRLADATPENAGPKAATLGRLAQAGFPVPPAFVIPADIYRDFVSDLDLPTALSTHGPAEARRLIKHHPLPPRLLKELTEALTDLANLPLPSWPHGQSTEALAELANLPAASGPHGQATEPLTEANLSVPSRPHDQATEVLTELGRDPAPQREPHRSPGSSVPPVAIPPDPIPPDAIPPVAVPPAAVQPLALAPVAVRSSASTEDSAAGSAAGQYDSYLGVQGIDAVADAVRATWASLWTHRAITYRQAPGPSPDPAMAVIVQRHIDAEVAGVLFTADSTTPGGASLIEASWGLGESVVQGLVTPDAYTVTPTAILERHLGTKLTRADRTQTGTTTPTRTTTPTGTTTTPVAQANRERPSLTDPQLHHLNQLGREVAALLGTPQDIEFALTPTHLWLLQSRPITTPVPNTTRTAASNAPVVSTSATSTAASPPNTSGEGGSRLRGLVEPPAALQGTAGSAGVVSGPARLVNGPEDFRRVQAGDILVCRFTDPAWTPLFTIVSGVITETGGRLSHAAIVAREHRIPAVLGVPSVMTTLHDGQPVTINGTPGTVHPAAIP